MPWFAYGLDRPAHDADRPTRLRFVRDLILRSTLVMVPVTVLAGATINWTWTLVCGGVIAISLLDAGFLTWQVRRLER